MSDPLLSAAPHVADALAPAASRAAWPIRALHEEDRPALLRHLLALGAQDRYLRFGYPATDAHIGAYVAGLDFGRDEVYGVEGPDLEIIAMAHLAYLYQRSGGLAVEYGVSVAAEARGQGLGKRLFERAVVHARTQGAQRMLIHALSENAPMLHIARSAGARVVRDGSESEAMLELPPARFEDEFADRVAEQRGRLRHWWAAAWSAVRQRFARGCAPRGTGR